ncbi:MAG: hypothetical protein J2P18_05530 [Nocardia sp.]|nr:hypothetical protein [Nocardia sp.]
MGGRTPWNTPSTSAPAGEQPHRATSSAPRDRRPLLAPAGTIALSAITVILQFQPWLSGSGRAGTIRSDAFGHLDGAVRQTLWAPSDVAAVDINGIWGVFTCAAAILTVFAAAAHYMRPNSVYNRAAAGTGSAMALFVVANLLNMNGKIPQLRAAVNNGGSGFLGALFGGGNTIHSVGSAGLCGAALIAGVTAFGAAVCAVAPLLPTQSRTGTADTPEPAAAPVAAYLPGTPPAPSEPVRPPSPVRPAAGRPQPGWRIVIPATATPVAADRAARGHAEFLTG